MGWYGAPINGRFFNGFHWGEISPYRSYFTPSITIGSGAHLIGAGPLGWSLITAWKTKCLSLFSRNNCWPAIVFVGGLFVVWFGADFCLLFSFGILVGMEWPTDSILFISGTGHLQGIQIDITHQQYWPKNFNFQRMFPELSKIGWTFTTLYRFYATTLAQFTVDRPAIAKYDKSVHVYFWIKLNSHT